jgi:membrane associated rhomboid family serine protease
VEKTSEPIFNVPGVILALILGLAAVQGLRDWVLGEAALLWDFALIPARFSHLLGSDPLQALSDRLAADPDNAMLLQRLALARELMLENETKPWTLVTYAGLHGSWMHLVLNSIWLLAFGSAVARRFGAVRFLAFFAVTALAGGVAHVLTHVDDVIPMVGASAAVSGCMAAAIRFVFQPGAPLGVFRLGDEHAYRLPALPLGDVLRDRRVMSFLVVWFGMNLATGLAGTGLGITDATIAWEAHVGGFLAGLFGFPAFDPASGSDRRG